MTEKRTKILLWAALAAAVLFLFAAFYSVQDGRGPIKTTAFQLNTVVQITIYDSENEKLLEEAVALCDTYEKIFSRTLPESELYQLNHGMLPEENGYMTISDPLAELIAEGLRYSRLSEGAFDISVAPLSSLWDFASREHRIPDADVMESAAALVNYEDIILEGNRIRFEKEGMQLELGAIAKGYIADKLKEFLISKGVRSAIIDLGGNVLCIGEKPDKEPFRIGVQKPFATRNETAGMIEIADCSVVSSGIYERYFEKEGKIYHHILDPRTGNPYENGLASVTIVSERSVDGDGLSTSCFALGLEKGMELVDSLPDTEAVFITGDGELHFSRNFKEKLNFQY